MGDVGSLALGTLIATIAFALDRPILLIPFCAIFLLELISSLVQGISRRLFGRRLFKMAPLHHHFEILGWSEEKIVMRFWLFGAIFAIFGFLVMLM